MARTFPAIPALNPVRELFAEAGRAINDNTRDLNSVAIPDFVKSAAATVGGALAKTRSYGSSSVTNVTAAISTSFNAAGNIASHRFKKAGDSIRRGFGAVAEQAESLRSLQKRIIPKSKRQSETLALLQEALRKHDALIREVQTKNTSNAERLEYLNRLVLQLRAIIGSLRADLADTTEEDLIAVLTVQGQQIVAVQGKADNLADRMGEPERFFCSDDDTNPDKYDRTGTGALPAAPPSLRPWSEMLAKAQAECIGVPSFDNILSAEEQAAVRTRLADWGEEFYDPHRLTGFDYAVAGTAGTLAALADIFLVWVPKHPGFLGAAGSEGGWLSNVIRERFDDLLPDDTVEALERAYKVPYDASTNFGLDEAVAGLGPRSHRLHSLGHDPVLGWIFGVRDIMRGEFTAVGKDGSVVIQSVAGWDPEEVKLTNLIGAFRSVGGHMLSDVSTAAGVPPPIFALSQFFQFGDIGGHNIAEIARAMYRSGYDLRHFMAGGTCVALIEIIVRTSWLVREMAEGRPLMDALPVANKPRLRTGLLLAHSVAAAINAGKVAITQNPLALNWAQWLAFFRYIVPQALWVLVEKSKQRDAFIRGQLDHDWIEFNAELSKTWQRSFASAPVISL